MEIVWKDIPGHVGYQVSDQGNVRTKRRKRWGGLASHWNPKKLSRRGKGRDYQCVGLVGSDGVQITHAVHQLVLLAFVGPCPEGMQALHKNDIKDDNRLENLRYGTPKQNVEDAKENGLWTSVGEDHWNATLDDTTVLEIKRRLLTNPNQTELAKEFHTTVFVISQIRTGRTWSHLKVEGFEELEQRQWRKLDEVTARAIKKAVDAGESPAVVARRYKVPRTTVNDIKHRRTWKDLKEEVQTKPEEEGDLFSLLDNS